MTSVWLFVKKHPLLQFALVAGLVFLYYQWQEAGTKPEIVVSGPIIEDLVDQRSVLLGRELTEAESKELIDLYIEEEILLREAYNQGLDQNDSKLRDRLIAKMRFLLSKETTEPPEDTLRAFYQAQRSLYMKPEYVFFDQVFFKAANAPTDRQNFLDQLTAASNPLELGETPPFGNHPQGFARSDLNMIFGETDADSIFTTEPETWAGPITSEQGVHYYRVTERIEAVPYSYDQVREFVREDWSVFQSKASLSRKIATLKKGYSIKIND